MEKRKLKIIFKNYKNWWGALAVLVFSIIVTIGLVQEIEKNKIIFEQLNQIQPITFDKNGDSKKPAHRSLNTDYIKVVVTYTPNEPPTVGTVTLDEGDEIIVVGNSSTTVVGTTTITDTNGKDDISGATATLYRQNATTCNSGATGARWCYAPACTFLTASTTSSRDMTCTVDVWFLAEPTYGTSSYTADKWQMDIMATDGDSATGFGSTSQELYTLYYIDASSTINYSTVGLGATSSNIQTTIYNQGNVPIDPYLKGDDMVGTTTDATISMARQKYSSSSQGNWDGIALSDASTGYNLDLATPTATTTDSYDDLYWMIKIPDIQLADDYYGTNTVSAGAAM